MYYHFASPDLNFSLEEMKKIALQISKITHSDVLIFDENGNEI